MTFIVAVVLMLITLLVSTTLILSTLVPPNLVVPGPEGVHAYFYAIQADGRGVQPIENMGVGDIITRDTSAYCNKFSHKTPTYFILDQWYTSPLYGSTGVKLLSLEGRIKPPETNYEVNKRGDPALGWSDITGTRTLEYYKLKRNIDSNTVEFKKYVLNIVPVDIILQFSHLPITDNIQLAYEDLTFWMAFDVVKWRDAFTSNPFYDPNPPEENCTLSAYTYGGGFPIFAWVGTWDPMVWNEQDGKPGTPESLTNAENQVNIAPSITGTQVDLFTEPDFRYKLTLARDIIRADALRATRGDNTTLLYEMDTLIPQLPDPNFAVTVFTPITLTKFGTYNYVWYSWVLPAGHTTYYPACYLRIRMLYAIYGEFTYLWTTQKAEDFGYVFENRSSTTSTVLTPWGQFWEGVYGLLSSPLFWLSMTLLGIFIIIVVLIIFAPSVLLAIFGIRRRK